MKSIYYLLFLFCAFIIFKRKCKTEYMIEGTMNEEQQKKMDKVMSQIGNFISGGQDVGRTFYWKGKQIATKEDITNAYKYAYQEMCKSKGFKFNTTGNEVLNFSCSHTEETCKRDSSFLNGSNSKNINDHLEWRPNSKQCVIAYKDYRDFCENEKLDYDENIGQCKVNKKYCECKGVEYKSGDCKYREGQRETATVTGKTLSQHFTRPAHCWTLDEVLSVANPYYLVGSQVMQAAGMDDPLKEASKVV